MNELTRVDPIPMNGKQEWPDQVEHEKDDHDSKKKEGGTLDQHYREVIGQDPPGNMTFDEKYRRVAMELFGSDDEADDHGDQDAGSGEIDSDGRGDHGPGENEHPPPSKTPRPDRTSMSCKTCASKCDAQNDNGFMTMVAMAAEVNSPAPRKKISPISDRRLIEYCCAADSLLGAPSIAGVGCAVVRLTIENDLTTEEGLNYATKSVNEAPPDQYVHFWASLPCTAGSPWQSMNRHRNPEAEEKIDRMGWSPRTWERHGD